MFRRVVPTASPFQHVKPWKPCCGFSTPAPSGTQGYPNYKIVHRRFQQWCREETLRKVLTDLANTLREEGEIRRASSTRALPRPRVAVRRLDRRDVEKA